MNRRTEILSGELSFPKQILTILNPKEDIDKTMLLDGFFQNCWHNFLRETTVNNLLWYDKFNNPKLFNSMLLHLSKAGWITSSVEINFAYSKLNDEKLLKWVTQEELMNVKFTYKFQKYRLKKTKAIIPDLVQLNNKHTKTGLVRKGFMKQGNSVFRYNTKYLKKYQEQIAINVKKGLEGSTKDITYQEICDELLNYYSVDGTEYTLGECIMDSRGRAIYQCSKKVFNPISCKDARALLVHPKPETLTRDGFQVVYMAIAELLGYRGKNAEDKAKYGQSAYIFREMPELEEMELKNNYDDLHIRIWLERIYENLDSYETTKWYVPICIDATASALQIMGVLMNNHFYMQGTNLISHPNGFQDIWSRPYCSRTHVKKAMTPKLYGSGKHTKELWDKNKLSYTQVQLNKMAQDISEGVYSDANKFKDFIINHVQPKKTMEISIWGEKFFIECNRFKWQIVTVKDYFIYTSSQGIMKQVTKESNLVPDTNQFKRYFVTCLIHSLDSRIADAICLNVPWVLSCHDSFTIHPNDAYNVRHWYTTKLYEIYHHRKAILKEYFKSVGITQQYNEAVDEEVSCFSPYCLK